MIAGRIAFGISVADTQARFGVVYSTVATACREFGVAMPPRKRPDVGALTLEIVAVLQNTNDTRAAIATRFNRHPSRVSHILGRARDADIRFPNRPTERNGETNAPQQTELHASAEGASSDG